MPSGPASLREEAVRAWPSRCADRTSDSSHRNFGSHREVDGGDTIPLRAVVVKPDWSTIAAETGNDGIGYRHDYHRLYNRRSRSSISAPCWPRSLKARACTNITSGSSFNCTVSSKGYTKRRGIKTKTAMEVLAVEWRQQISKTLLGARQMQSPSFALCGAEYPRLMLDTKRNALDHEGEELRTSIELLRSWTRRQRSRVRSTTRISEQQRSFSRAPTWNSFSLRHSCETSLRAWMTGGVTRGFTRPARAQLHSVRSGKPTSLDIIENLCLEVRSGPVIRL